MVTCWEMFSDDVLPLPPSHAFHEPVRAGRPVLVVIAKDLFSAFDPDDMFAPDVAHAYRDKVLGMGGRKDAADLVADFLGRPYSFDSWTAWLAE